MGENFSRKMLCPCCGEGLTLSSEQCDCGARFVGHPLDQSPVRVKRYGHVFAAGTLFAAIVTASFIFTKWLALAGVVALWSSWRAMRLAKTDPENYGGYRAALTILAIVSVASSVVTGLGIAYIPRYLDAYTERQFAASRASIYHIKGLLEDYRSAKGSYPVDHLAFKDYLKSREEPVDALPADYWESAIEYKSHAETAGLPGVGIDFNNFQLRSAGPDKKFGTADDIIMRDGIFISASEPPKPPVLSGATSR